jgi:hypothetical protein
LRAFHIEVGKAEHVQPWRQARLRQEHGAELAGSDQADLHRPSCGFALQQKTMEIHRTRLTGVIGTSRA